MVKKKKSDHVEQLKRAQAELANLQKRTEREKGEFARFANQELIIDLLPVLDNFDRALQHVPEADQNSNWLTGVTYIQKQLLEVLNRQGVSVKEVKVGEMFDAGSQHAIEHRQSDQPENTVIQVINQAYVMNDTVIRPAAVIVSAGKDAK
ncbi:MAG: nucleotide exchange factor GrpE [bacterium]|nr:nucleotide exchange factor GrpE [bacterium]